MFYVRDEETYTYSAMLLTNDGLALGHHDRAMGYGPMMGWTRVHSAGHVLHVPAPICWHCLLLLLRHVCGRRFPWRLLLIKQRHNTTEGFKYGTLCTILHLPG